MARPPRIPMLLSEPTEVIYFVTCTVEDRQTVLANDACLTALKTVASKIHHWHFWAAILMPDHVHALVSPFDREIPVTDFTRLLKRWIRQELGAEWKWQDGVFDRLLRREESLQEKWAYMRENPVRAGLVRTAGEWPYSIGIQERSCGG